MRYDYRCQGCGYTEEREYPALEKPDTIECPSCEGSVMVTVILQAPGVELKGSGWPSKFYKDTVYISQDKLPKGYKQHTGL
jgi:putative FmdB family regulatory protein